MSKCTKESCEFKKLSGTCMSADGGKCPYNVDVIKNKSDKAPYEVCESCLYNECGNKFKCSNPIACVMHLAYSR